MARFIEGDYRLQATLLSEALDDYITEDNPVRVVDVFVDQIDLDNMGFLIPCRQKQADPRIILPHS